MSPLRAPNLLQTTTKADPRLHHNPPCRGFESLLRHHTKGSKRRPFSFPDSTLCSNFFAACGSIGSGGVEPLHNAPHGAPGPLGRVRSGSAVAPSQVGEACLEPAADRRAIG